MDILSSFAETLVELMFIENLNAEELSNRITIERSSITRYLERKTIPTLPYAIKLADYFGCSLDYLFGLTNDYKKSNYSTSLPFHKAFQESLRYHNSNKYRLNRDLGLAHQGLIAWYKGSRMPSMDTIIRIANYLGCTLDELVGRKAVE